MSCLANKREIASLFICAHLVTCATSQIPQAEHVKEQAEHVQEEYEGDLMLFPAHMGQKTLARVTYTYVQW